MTEKRVCALACLSFSMLLTGVAGAQEGAPPAGAAPPMAPAEAAPAESGGAHTHDGFFMRLGLNFGPLMLKYKSEINGTQVGGDLDASGLTIGSDLLLGGTPIDGLVIGGALIYAGTKDPTLKQGGAETTADGSTVFGGIGVFGQYYFDPKEGGHVQLLLGYGAVDFVSSSGQSGGNDPTGLMVGIGGGYDIWLGSEWSFGPFARVLYAPTSVEEGAAKVTANYLFPSIGIGFTLH